MAADNRSDTFTERELALILKRASEAQGTEIEPSRMRYSLSEIQDIALQAGIDRDTVANAAAELRRPAQSTPWLLGGPTRFRAERMADATLPATAFADIVEAIRLETGLQGEAKQVFETLEWKGQDVGGHVFVTITPRDQRTRVTVSAARGDDAVLVGMMGAGAAVVVFFASLATLGVVASLPPEVVGPAAILASGATMVGVTRLLWRRKMEKWRRRVTDVADAVVGRLSPK